MSGAGRGTAAPGAPASPLALYTDLAGTDPGAATRLLAAAGFRVQICDLRSADEVEAQVADAQPEALLVSYLSVGARAFAAAPSIRIVSCSSVGFDCVDVEAADAAGVWVANVPDAASEEVASHALAMALALLRHLPFLDRHVREGGWAYQATGMPRRLSETALGVIGMGRIGRRLAAMGTGLFGRVVGVDETWPGPDWPAGVRRVALEQALAQCDVVSLHLPLTGGSRHLIAAETLAMMRPGSYLVNVSRGGLIDPEALLVALDDGRLAGAALDVTDPEPPEPDERVRHHPRILITPHSAFLSTPALEGYVLRQAENVIAWHRTGRPNTPVNALAAAPGRGEEGWR